MAAVNYDALVKDCVECFDEQTFRDKVIPTLESIFKQTAELALKAAAIIAKLSRPQRKRVAQIFKSRGIDGDYVERLHDFGRGQLPEYLARSNKTLKASQWRALDGAIRKTLWNGEKVVDVQYQHVIKPVRLCEFTRMEWRLVLDPHKGLRTVEEQRKEWFRASKPPTKTEREVAEHADQWYSLIASKRPGYCVMVGQNSKHEVSSAIEFPLRDVRNRLGDF